MLHAQCWLASESWLALRSERSQGTPRLHEVCLEQILAAGDIAEVVVQLVLAHADRLRYGVWGSGAWHAGLRCEQGIRCRHAGLRCS